MVAALLALLLAAVQPAPSPAAPAGTPPLASSVPQPAPAKAWPVTEGDYDIADFRFHDGATLPRVRMHYRTLGRPHRNAAGEIDNAVMVLHGTGGSGAQFLAPQFADELYGPGQPLDFRHYWIILPDNLGHGRSAKPSDGLRMRFPRYDYADMVEAQHRLAIEGLGIRRLRLVMGTSMGCMHIFVMGEAYPDFARAMMPMACQAIELAGLNRMWRQLVIDGIKADPAWLGGDYQAEPQQGLRTAETVLFIGGAAPLNLQKHFPKRDDAAAYATSRVNEAIRTLDANDLIYQVDASRTYDPWGGLEQITAPVTWINSADDFINPRGLDAPHRAVARMKNARFRLVPETADTHGHGTHTWAVNWRADLVDLLARTEGS